MEDKVFEIVGRGTQSFQYVVLKMNDIEDQITHSKKLLVQIMDMSDKILYNEVKAE
jgi:hypothetical protein